MRDQFKSKRKTGKFLIYSIVVFLIAIFFNTFPETISNFFNSGNEIKNKITISIKSKEDLIIENTGLKKKLEIYENPKNLFYFYKQENKKLKEELGYKNFSDTERKIFSIFSDGKSNFYETLLIKDTENFIKIGDLVFYKFNLLIGKIIEKSGELAKIQLFSQSGVENNFHLSDNGEIKMEVTGIGQGGGVIRVDAPREIEFKNPEKVFLVSKENNSYLVAELVDQKFKTQDTNKVLYFKIFANQNLLSQVEIQK